MIIKPGYYTSTLSNAYGTLQLIAKENGEFCLYLEDYTGSAIQPVPYSFAKEFVALPGVAYFPFDGDSW